MDLGYDDEERRKECSGEPRREGGVNEWHVEEFKPGDSEEKSRSISILTVSLSRARGTRCDCRHIRHRLVKAGRDRGDYSRRILIALFYMLCAQNGIPA